MQRTYHTGHPSEGYSVWFWYIHGFTAIRTIHLEMVMGVPPQPVSIPVHCLVYPRSLTQPCATLTYFQSL